MKTRFLIIIVGAIITSSIIFVMVWNYNNANQECDEECEIERRRIGSGQGAQGVFEPTIREEQYSIQITGMNKMYRIGEQYDFSYVITGYGYSCGSTDVSFPDQNGEIVTISSSGLCAADVPMRNFVFDIQKEHGTTYGHVKVKNPGIYNVTVTFDRPSSDSPTTEIKEFRVPPINSWYNNRMTDTDDLQTVIDSCANDSSKERMTDSLRYSNGTHVFLNLECKWQTIGVFVGE